MKPVDVATIAVRLLGLVIVLLTVDSLLRIGVVLINQIGSRIAGPSTSIRMSSNVVETIVAASGFIPFALGLYMFFSGRWFIRRIVRGLGPPAEGVCPACNYDLTGLRVSRCPECGEKLPKGIVTAATSAPPHRSRRGGDS